MPDNFSLRYLPAAQDDLFSIPVYIAKDSPSRAVPLVDKLDERIARFESYLVFYVVRGKTIQIHRVIHGSRDLNHLI